MGGRGVDTYSAQLKRQTDLLNSDWFAGFIRENTVKEKKQMESIMEPRRVPIKTKLDVVGISDLIRIQDLERLVDSLSRFGSCLQERDLLEIKTILENRVKENINGR